MNLLEEKIGKILEDVGRGKSFPKGIAFPPQFHFCPSFGFLSDNSELTHWPGPRNFI